MKTVMLYQSLAMVILQEAVFSGGQFSGTPLPAVGDTDGTGISNTPKPAQVEAVTRTKEYSKYE